MGPMDAVKGVKEIADLVRKYNDLPLYDKLVQLQTQITEQASDLLRVNAENQDLRQQAALRERTSFRNPYYYEEGDEIPLCPKCFATSDGKLRVHMSHPPADYMEGHGRHCVVCGIVVKEGPRKGPRKPGEGGFIL